MFWGSVRKKGYIFADGDESFYRFIGKNSIYPMLELIHPDDVEEFQETVGKLSFGEQCILVRMKCYDNSYQCLYMTMRLNGREYDDFQSFTFEFCDIMEIKEKYAVYLQLVKKYRAFMSLSSQLFFEYTFDTDELNIYHYVSVKSCPLLKKKLETIKDEVEGSIDISSKSKAEFDIFYNHLKKGTDRFEIELDAKVLIPEEEQPIRYRLKGTTMYRRGVKTMLAGIIHVSGVAQKKESYYLTEGALDPGTGLFNKRAINEYAIEKIQEFEQAKKSFYLAIVDVDDFKKINDTYGHMFGDEVLSKVSVIMREVLDARGIVGRFGGDEFMIIFESVNTEEQLRRIVKTICKHIQWTYESLQEKLVITTSWGVAKYPDDGTNYEELFKKADKSLYIAKAKGKNRLIIYDEKKHGSFVKQEEGTRSNSIRMIASDEKKAAVMSELVIELYRDGQKAFGHVMEQMSAYFDMDGIAIYQGEDMHRTFSYGKYINPIESLVLIKEKAYLELFDKQGVYEESNVKRLSNSFADLYSLYEQQENGKFIQCIFTEEDVPKALISFDFFNRSPKFGTTDMGMIKIVGRLMAEVAGK